MVKRGDMREVLAVTLIGVFLGVGLPTLSLFVFGGAESQANMVKFFFYGIMLFASILAVDMVRLLKSEGFFARNKDLEPFSRMTAHSPSNTVLYNELKEIEPVGSAVAKTIKSPSRLLFFSWIISLIMGAYISIKGTFVSGTPKLVEGQITESAQLSLAVEPAVISETLFFFVFLFYSQVGALAWFFHKKLGLSMYWAIILAKIFAVPLVTVEFIAYHLFRYGTQEASLLGVGLLGFSSALTVAVFDSIIPAYMVHASGNFFEKLHELGIFTSQTTILVVSVVGLVTTLLYFWIIDPFNVFRGEDETISGKMKNALL